MKRKGLIIGIAIVAVIFAAGVFFLCEKHRTSRPPQVSNGKLETFKGFHHNRTISVWLPDGYTTGEPCDVLYMHDGQMLFDSTTTWNHQEWQVDEILGRLEADKTIPRTIVVAIDNTPDRLKDYFPDKTCRYTEEADQDWPKGDSYLRFIVEEVKPFIDTRYQPLTDREHTFIAGSSMGGLISLYALCEYPEVFGGAACLSSHLSMAYLDVCKDSDAMAEGFLNYVSDNMPDKETTRIYMDYGLDGYDAAYGPYQQRMDSLFRAKGWDEDHYRSLSFEGQDHRESFWAQRLPGALTFLVALP